MSREVNHQHQAIGRFGVSVLLALALALAVSAPAVADTGSAGSSTLVHLTSRDRLSMRTARQVIHSVLRYEGVSVRMGACRRAGARRVSCADSIYLSVTFAGTTTYEWAASHTTATLTPRGRILVEGGGLKVAVTL